MALLSFIKSYWRLLLLGVLCGAAGIASGVAWHLYTSNRREAAYNRATAENTKATQAALAQAEKYREQAIAKEAEAELLKRQIDARSQKAVAKAQELLERERDKQAELNVKAQADEEAIAEPATECQRLRDICARWVVLAKSNPSLAQYICKGDPCEVKE